MKTRDLENKIIVHSLGCGRYLVIMDYRGKELSCYSNDSVSYDRISEHKNGESDLDKLSGGLTYKQSLETFWNECLLKNGIR